MSTLSIYLQICLNVVKIDHNNESAWWITRNSDSCFSCLKPHSWFLCLTRCYMLTETTSWNAASRQFSRGEENRQWMLADPEVTRALYAFSLGNMEAVRFRPTLVNRQRWYTGVHGEITARECSSRSPQLRGEGNERDDLRHSSSRAPFLPFANRVNPLSNEVSLHDKIHRASIYPRSRSRKLNNLRGGSQMCSTLYIY